MGMATFTAGRQKRVWHIEDGRETRESDTQKGSTREASRGGETNSGITLHAPSKVLVESRRAERRKGTPLRFNTAQSLLVSDQEPCMRWEDERYRARDAGVLPGELIDGNSTQRLKIVVRIRPAEDASAARMATVLPDGKTVCLVPAPAKIGCKEQLDQGWPRKSKRELRATFDRVLGESADQWEVYDQVRACVRYTFLGVNACVLAYGQTGSGKTYTMMGDSWRQDARVRWARSTSQGDSERFPEGKLLVQPNGEAPGCDKQPTQSAVRNTRQKHEIVAVGQEGVIPRVVREIFLLLQRFFDASTSASRAPLSSLPVKENIPQDVETQRATSSSICASPVSWGTDGDRGGDRKSSSASSYSGGVRVDEPPPTRRSFIEQNGYQDLRQQRKGVRREGYSATDAGSSKRVHESRRGTRPGTSCMVECSYIQIYNDRVYDLLSDETEQKPLSVLDSASNFVAGTEAADRDCPTGGGEAVGEGSWHGHCVVGLSVHHVEDAEQALRLFRRGAEKRRVRSTQMNANSSRSHCIVQFTISSTTTKSIRETLSGAGKPGTPHLTCLPGKSNGEPDPKSEAPTPDPETAMTTRATLSLVDLAGSERGCIGEGDMGARELERKRINASLSALSNCIFRLGESGRTHIPFRDSSLTRLLRGSLEGGKTVLIATISPTVDSQAESISTLQFAARCTQVIVKQRVNEVTSDALLLKRARSQISYLRRRLRQLENTSAALERSSPSTTPASAITGSMTTVFAYDNKAEDAVRYQKGKPSAARPSRGDFEQKRRFHYSEELDRGAKLGADDLGSRGVFQSVTETSRGQLHRATTGTCNRNDEAPDSAKKKPLDGARRGRDLLIHSRSPPEGRGQRSANLKADWIPGHCATLGRAISSKGWKPRTVRSRSRKYSLPVGTDDDGAVAMAALVERFSSWEGELLREIESWKAKYERVERESRGGDCHAANVLNCWSGGKRSASSATIARHSQRARVVGPGLADKGGRPGRASDAAPRTVRPQTMHPRGGERSASLRHQESKDTQRERMATVDGKLPGRKRELELRQGEAIKVRGQLAKGGNRTDLFPRNSLKKCTTVDDAGQVPVDAMSPTFGHRLSCAELRTTSNGAFDDSITDGNGDGRISLAQVESGSDKGTRDDVDRHVSSGRIVEKMDYFAETATETSALANDHAVPGEGKARVIPRSTSSNMASSAPYDAASIDVMSVCLKEAYLAPRKSAGLERPASTQAFVPTTVVDHFHDTETCGDETKMLSGGLLKRGAAGGERNTEIPNAGEPSHAPAHGHWPATDGRSQPVNTTLSPGRKNTCGRHRLSSCVLCNDSPLHVDEKSSPSNAPPEGESTKPKEGVTIAACAPTGFIDPTGDGSCGTHSLEEHRLSAAGVAVISRENGTMPCLPHLLPNCVLCKMQKGRFGRSASLSALGPTYNGAGKTHIPAPSRLRTSKPIARRKNQCEQHDMSDHLPCNDPDSAASVSKSDGSDPRGGHGSTEPLLLGHSPSSLLPRQDLHPSTSLRQLKVLPKRINHDGVLDTPVITTAGARLAEGPRVFASNSDDDEDAVPPHHRPRFPPAALGPRRSGIRRGVSDDNPAPGDHYTCYGREIGKRYARDAYTGRNKGKRRHHRGNKPLARSRQSSSSNTGSRRPGGERTDAAGSRVRLRESDNDVNDFVARALTAARAVL